ncbi:hypothetical protein Acid345_3378 [Candidatus Koribacter versatilis Ellin345]|uniref:Uncharacterized protein n=1 Tax=Koribacter versatilis (strain Ellin345) TaxID=204669 RepID=Q1IL71_KORVE|nr:hypothetical protein [Candidatus Koribacter versatilis]ABF42379.1 hypothetical protein Acid345_3378 [Candidatus Koribacter versatilis Ellin345]
MQLPAEAYRYRMQVSTVKSTLVDLHLIDPATGLSVLLVAEQVQRVTAHEMMRYLDGDHVIYTALDPEKKVFAV